MLPADVYRPGRYPPGPNWAQFGDPYLEKAFAGLSAEAEDALRQKSEFTRQMHRERFKKLGIIPMQPPIAGTMAALLAPPVTEREIQRQSFLPLEDDGYVTADEGPEPPQESGLMRLASGAAGEAASLIGSGLANAATTAVANLAGAGPVAATVASGAAQILKPIATNLVVGGAKMAAKAGGAVLNAAQNHFDSAVDFYVDGARQTASSIADRFKDKSPLQLLLENPNPSFRDIISFIDSARTQEPPPQNELTQAIDRNVRLGYEPPPWEPSGATPALTAGGSSSSSSSSAPRPAAPRYTSYNTVQEWLANVKNRGAMVEELYKRPGWAKAVGITNEKGYHGSNSREELAKKLKKMKREDLAKILIYLDAPGGAVLT